MANTPANQIVWIDCEMTGLQVEQDALCELAIIVTDFELQPLHPGIDIVINPGAEALARMNDFVREMHTKSGLLAQIPQGASITAAEEQALEYVNSLVDAGARPLVGGNTIGMDRRFIAKYMPKLDERLHYRSIDVSTVKELSRQWHPKAFFCAPEKHGGHRALADIAESIQELAYFRAAVMQPSPGPGATDAKQLAEDVSSRFASLISSTKED